ncbi:MAG: DUF429 domain-containing protein [Flavobacteriales bacterium]|nr:DUF429 domain-containing protein [Flavobacteriales bacterium]MDW8432328.1 DUF429 domain-containing protein [Flavobacteriales bacterium]
MAKLGLGGLDLGSRFRSTSVLCVLQENGRFTFFTPPPSTDGHAWIYEKALELKLSRIFIDAPLSLPGIYRNPEKFQDYHFRQADIALSAMSPMFLGGFTASAMQLAARWKTAGLEVMETYPAGLVRMWGLQHVYVKKENKDKKECLSAFILALQECAACTELSFPEDLQWPVLQSWHEADALSCFLSGWRYQLGKAVPFGMAEEGLIWI